MAALRQRRLLQNQYFTHPPLAHLHQRRLLQPRHVLGNPITTGRSQPPPRQLSNTRPLPLGPPTAVPRHSLEPLLPAHSVPHAGSPSAILPLLTGNSHRSRSISTRGIRAVRRNARTNRHGASRHGRSNHRVPDGRVCGLGVARAWAGRVACALLP